MSDLSHHIQNLLCLSDSLIIPGFGKIFRTYHPAELNPLENKLNPPFYTLGFDFSIQEDDSEVLAHYLSKTENISFESAAESVFEFKKGLLQQIFAGETAQINGIGKFSLKDGNFFFEADKLSKANPFEGFEVLDALPVKRDKLDAEAAPKTARKRFPVSLIAVLVILPLLVVLLFTVDFNGKTEEKKNDSEKPAANHNNSADSTEQPAADSSITVAADTIIAEPAPQPKPELKEYHIVVGTFSGEENARKTESKMKAAGYETRLKKFNNGKVRVSVSVRVYNEAELDVQLKKVREKFEKGAFVAD